MQKVAYYLTLCIVTAWAHTTVLTSGGATATFALTQVTQYSTITVPTAFLTTIDITHESLHIVATTTITAGPGGWIWWPVNFPGGTYPVIAPPPETVKIAPGSTTAQVAGSSTAQPHITGVQPAITTDIPSSTTVITSASIVGTFGLRQDTRYSDLTTPTLVSTHLETTQGTQHLETDTSIWVAPFGWLWFPIVPPGGVFPAITPPIPTVAAILPVPEASTTAASGHSNGASSSGSSTSECAVETSGVGRRAGCERPSKYFVFPKDPKPEAHNAILPFLVNYTRTAPKNLDATRMTGFGVIFWTVSITKAQAAQLSKIPGVS